MRNFFSILGGMGTLASENFIHQLNKRTPAAKDQDYLNYILFNHAAIPDRTAHILDPLNEADPVPYLLDDIRQQELLQPEFIVLTCNTAHYFYEELQAATDIPILHMPRETAKEIQIRFPQGKVAILATEGTIQSGIYEKELQKNNRDIYLPPPPLQKKINQLIYQDVKEQSFLNQKLYLQILQTVSQAGCKAIILGCTELSLVEDAVSIHPYPVIDAQAVLIERTIERTDFLTEKITEIKTSRS